MLLSAGLVMNIECPADSPAVLALRPQTGAGQTILESSIATEPPVELAEFRDLFGNICQRALFPPGAYTITVSCRAEAADAIDVHPDAGYTLIQDLPNEVLPFLLPSRYCESDKFLKMAGRITKNAPPGYGQVEAIRKWISKKLKYKYGVSNASTSAADTAKKKAGVCRDFSHLAIALCRALRIPARMVGGFMFKLDPMDLHAWFEAFVGGRWYTFDATQGQPKGNRVIIAYGRDAADIAQLSEYGPIVTKSQKVWVNAE